MHVKYMNSLSFIIQNKKLFPIPYWQFFLGEGKESTPDSLTYAPKHSLTKPCMNGRFTYIIT